MLTTAVLILLLVISCLALGAFGYYRYSRTEIDRLKKKLRSHSEKAEQLSQNYDEYRRKYIDLDDRFQEVQNMEQTYRVAYQEWKAKYEDLVSKSRSDVVILSESRDEKEEAILHDHWKKRAQEAEEKVMELTNRIRALEMRNEELTQKTHDLNLQKEALENLRSSFIKIYDQFKGLSEEQISP